MESNRFLDRAEAAQYLTERGLRTSKNTLQKWVTVGGGPLYRRYGHRAVYLASDLDAWAARKMGTATMTYARPAKSSASEVAA